MKLIKKSIVALVILFVALTFTALAAPKTVQAAEDEVSVSAEATTDNSTSAKAIAAAITIGLAASAGAIGMGMSISKSAEGIARQPEAAGQIRTSLMLGLVFVETAIIYALIIAILIIFVL